MCRQKSGIIMKDNVFVPRYDSHTKMLEELEITDTRKNAENLFVRAELWPTGNDIFSDPATWEFHVDQDIRPDWVVEEYDRERFIMAVREWWKDHVFIGKNDLEIPTGTTYHLKDCKRVIVRSSTVESHGQLHGNSLGQLHGGSLWQLHGGYSRPVV